jgi:endonuclease/exonuclease/phosphatase family metal-dependent hydrolase
MPSISSRRLRLAALFLALLATAAVTAPGAAAAGNRGKPTVTVMTRNVYLGADLRPIFAASTVPGLFSAVGAAWTSAQANNFAERAHALAGEIEAARPDLVGLQEVALYRTDVPADGPATPATAVAADFLRILLDALAERGLAYDPVVVRTGADNELPSGFPPTMDVRLTIRDVILVRAEGRKPRLRLGSAEQRTYAANLVVSTPVGPAALPRGWASVDVMVKRRTFRFVNTHLEAFASPIQVAQANELLAALAAAPAPVVLVGDLNSRADGLGTSTYANVVAAGFRDAWAAARPFEPGFTCCHAADLRSASREPDQRIDYVLVRGGIRVAGADVVGEEPDDRTPSGLWPSDHAGVVATLALPKRRAER